MGAYAAKLKESGEYVGDRAVAATTDPTQSDWITEHAEATGLTMVEVERLWLRFKQLGCNENGVLLINNLKPELSDDIFVKNILKNLELQVNSGEVYFQTFLTALNWAEEVTTVEKLRAIFNFFTNGRDLTKDVFKRIVKRLYPAETDSSHSSMADLVFEEMDPENQGYITEEQFIQWIKFMPKEEIDILVSFYIVPPEVNDEAHRLFSAPYKKGAQPVGGRQPPVGLPGESDLSDKLLRKIAERAYRRDWMLLANKIGFLKRDLQAIEAQTTDKQEKVYLMLKQWRDQEGANASADALEGALRQSNMHDIAVLLQP